LCFVVVVPVVTVQTTYAEVLLHHLQTLNAFCALSYYKLMRHLEAGFVASTMRSMRLPDDVDRKAPLTVDKTGYPTNLDQSFLLIVRSWRIVTAVRLWQVRFTDLRFVIQRVSQHSRGFQHIAKFY
jgi:hypothetical protein